MNDHAKAAEVDRRTSDRIRDNSTLLVSGSCTSGASFVERTRANDISSDGVALWLKTCIEPSVVLDVSFWSENPQNGRFSLMASVKVLVLRITESADRFLVAGQFLNEFVCFGDPRKPEDIAKDLELAVELDEGSRSAEKSSQNAPA